MNHPLSRRTWLRQAGATALGLSLVRSSAWAQTSAESEAPPPEGRHINLAGNENSFGPSLAVTKAILRATPQSCRYPFREEVVLKQMIAKKEGVAPENILLGNGCDEILSLAGLVYGLKGGNIVASRPTYLQLTEYAEKFHTEIQAVNHTRSMQHDLPAMLQAVNDRTSLVYVCNPDNPSGTLVGAKPLADFCRAVAPRCPVFIDEVYLELVDDFAAQTQVPLVREGLPVIIGRSFSKMHALAGHRIGYAIAPQEIVKTLGHYQMSSVNYIGVAAARASLADSEFHRFSVRKIREGRERFYGLLDELKLNYIPSAGNFVFHHTGIPIREYEATMKERGFLVGRPFEPYQDWCRISIGTDDEMAKYATSMREVYSARSQPAKT